MLICLLIKMSLGEKFSRRYKEENFPKRELNVIILDELNKSEDNIENRIFNDN